MACWLLDPWTRRRDGTERTGRIMKRETDRLKYVQGQHGSAQTKPFSLDNAIHVELDNTKNLIKG